MASVGRRERQGVSDCLKVNPSCKLPSQCGLSPCKGHKTYRRALGRICLLVMIGRKARA
jgi:hypothetical protein